MKLRVVTKENNRTEESCKKAAIKWESEMAADPLISLMKSYNWVGRRPLILGTCVKNN